MDRSKDILHVQVWVEQNGERTGARGMIRRVVGELTKNKTKKKDRLKKNGGWPGGLVAACGGVRTNRVPCS